MCQNGARKKENVVRISNALLGATLTLVASSAAALSLGNSRGTVVLGAPIDLVFEVVPDPGNDVASSCVVAELTSGENRIGDSRVRVTPVAAGVRVQAYITADEPVLTAKISAGCSGRVSRTYTFLSQLPEAIGTPARPVDIGRLAQATPSVGFNSSSGSVGTAGSAGSGVAAGAAVAAPPRAATVNRAARARAEAPAAQRPQRAAAAAPRLRPAPAPAPVEEPRSRLVMEPLEVWLDAPLPLRTTSELTVTPPEAGDAKRAEAAALWKALNTPPEEMLQANARMRQLETEAAAQRAKASAERTAATQWKERAETLESQSFPAMVVYGLLGLLGLALALVLWMWSRSRRRPVEPDTWNQSVAAATQREPAGVIMDGPEGEEFQTAPQAEDVWPTPAPTPATAPVAMAAGSAIREAAKPAVFTPPVAPVVARTPAPASVSEMLPLLRPHQIVHPEEMFDIQQQAEFFVSVGEHDQAIEVLEHHIGQHRDTSPLAYLELLRLYHTLGRVDSFNQLRGQFQQYFNANAPEFSSFHRTGRLLEEYPDVLAAIEAQWPTANVVELLEGYVFRRAGAQAVAAAFDLGAYDDLLLLLAIAQTTPPSARGTPLPRKRTTPQGPAGGGSSAVGGAAAGAAAFAGTAAPAAAAAFALPPAPAVQAPAPVSAPADPHLMEPFSFDDMAAGLSLASSRPAPLAARPISEAMLDLDLSEPPHLTLSDLPALPVTAPPPPGQPVGFGDFDEKLEVRLELQERDKREPGKDH